MTIKTTDDVITTVPLTEAELERAVRQLTYRKLYNKRPEVREARRRYNHDRQQTIKLAMEAYRRSKEAV